MGLRWLVAIFGGSCVLGCSLFFPQRLTPSAGQDSAPPWPAWFKRVDPATPLPEGTLRLRWLGTAGFELSTRTTTVWIDPYLSRLPLWDLIRGPARPDLAAIHARLGRLDAVLLGHAHFDHMLDAPAIALAAGAPLYASEGALRIARAEGVPEPLARPLKPGARIRVGDFEIEVVESEHGPLPTQWLAAGLAPLAPKPPLFFLDYKNDEVFGFLIHWRGRRIYHAGSAAIRPDALRGKKADVLLACVSGWRSNPAFFRQATDSLNPRVVLPMHHDDFFLPFERGVVENPLAAYSDALVDLRQHAPAASVAEVSFFDDHRLEALP